MTKEEQFGVPPVEVMRQLLDENRALVRLLSADAINHDVDGTEREACAEEADSVDALVSAYRDVLMLLEILSATAAPHSGDEVSGQ